MHTDLIKQAAFDIQTAERVRRSFDDALKASVRSLAGARSRRTAERHFWRIQDLLQAVLHDEGNEVSMSRAIARPANVPTAARARRARSAKRAR